MLYYQKTITVLPSTVLPNPLVESIEVVKGVIKRVLVGFPAGCCGLVGVKLQDKTTQIVPYSLGEWLCFNSYVFDIQTVYPLLDPPYLIDVYVYNDDDTYPHTVFVAVWVDPTQTVDVSDLVLSGVSYGTGV